MVAGLEGNSATTQRVVSNCFAIFAYNSTASVSCFFSTYSPPVCAT